MKWDQVMAQLLAVREQPKNSNSRRIMPLAFNVMPHHLKSCFLYFAAMRCDAQATKPANVDATCTCFDDVVPFFFSRLSISFFTAHLHPLSTPLSGGGVVESLRWLRPTPLLARPPYRLPWLAAAAADCALPSPRVVNLGDFGQR